MRGLALAALVVLLLPGCLTADPVKTASLKLDKAPEGAAVETLEGGLRLVFNATKLPFAANFTVPPGTTLVRAHASVAKESTLSLVLRNADTNRRRCQTPTLDDSWGEARKGEMSCVALTAIDDLPATWRVQLGGPAASGVVQVDLLTTPVDGLAAQLDLSKLSKRTFELEATQVQMVPSWDGTLLHVETTRPKTDAKVPTVIVSSPYTNDERKLGLRPSNDLVLDWGARGYAIVVADVRGYGESQGCVEVWSANEQKDQKFLVDWVAQQPWSDGNVGFYGQSYVATTPVAAAVQAPAALKAIIAVAPVINSYDDWHFGGVPNGEDFDSPLEYQSIGMHSEVFSTPPPLTPDGLARAGNAFCDPTLEARANDPRGLYDAFFKERNFSARAKDVKAAVLYTQGFEDTNVKSMMAAWWFNALTAPKLGLFGHWIHQHPPRADHEVLFLGWMDEHVKGKELGFARLPAADVVTNAGTHRASATWPYAQTTTTNVSWKTPADVVLVPSDGSAPPVTPLPSVDLPVDALPTLASQATKLDAPLEIAGLAHLELAAQLKGADNAYVAAFLYDKAGSTSQLVTFGMYNLAHRPGHEDYTPVQPQQTVRVSLPFQPTDYVVPAGHELVLEIRGARVSDWDFVKPAEPGVLTVAAGTTLVLPTLDPSTAEPAPRTSDWVS